MKIQEKKTHKGIPFAIVKFSDLGGVFELFVFSEILESNRDILKEGNSMLITVVKDTNNQDNRFKRISIKKIANLNEISKQSSSLFPTDVCICLSEIIMVTLNDNINASDILSDYGCILMYLPCRQHIFYRKTLILSRNKLFII